jgi:DNA-binding transcriptional ArsR family regulator
MFIIPVKLVDLQYAQVVKALTICRAMNNPLRQSILKILGNQDDVTVTQIFTELKIDQSVTSSHLGILRRSNLVISRRKGKSIYYSLNHERMLEAYTILQKLLIIIIIICRSSLFINTENLR